MNKAHLGKKLPPAIVIAGPTASGKSALALQLAERFPCEIISVDSAQVFRDMDIGTAKPSAAERASVPHHLLDLISPEDAYSAARFRADAIAAMTDITARGKIPLLVGGTMLYLKALREGLAAMPSANPLLRTLLETEAHERGWPALHAELATLDAPTAARLAPNDSQRISRALEVVRATGRPLSQWIAEQPRDATLPCTLVGIALQPADQADRKVLHERIAQRFDAMLAAGLVGEVEHLRTCYHLHADLPSVRCVGYRQIWEVLEKTSPHDTLRDKVIFATRQLAKRQITWLRSMNWLTPITFTDALVTEKTLSVVEKALD
jgi:tRNA dimethylallyltransferase